MPDYAATLFVISAPSGAGKTSLVRKLVEEMAGIQVSVSHTTRPQRPGEHDGIDYHFVSQPEFLSILDETGFLEHAQVFGNFYGTSQAWVKSTLAKGIDVILEIDWQGAEQIRKLMPCCCIFILPPSIHALEARLKHRGQDSAEVIAGRLAGAREEMSHFLESDYLVINDDYVQALNELKSIVLAERCRTGRQAILHSKLLQDLQS